MSRGELAEAAGVEDDVLHFWLRHDLLEAEPAPPRKHRRFRPSEARIAAVLAEVRVYGVNIDALRKLALCLREGVRKVEAIGSTDFDTVYGEIDRARDGQMWLGANLLDCQGLWEFGRSSDGEWHITEVGSIEGRGSLKGRSGIVLDFWRILGGFKETYPI